MSDNFSNSTFERVTFGEADLSGADMTAVMCKQVDLRQATLDGVLLARAYLGDSRENVRLVDQLLRRRRNTLAHIFNWGWRCNERERRTRRRRSFGGLRNWTRG